MTSTIATTQTLITIVVIFVIVMIAYRALKSIGITRLICFAIDIFAITGFVGISGIITALDTLIVIVSNRMITNYVQALHNKTWFIPLLIRKHMLNPFQYWISDNPKLAIIVLTGAIAVVMIAINIAIVLFLARIAFNRSEYLKIVPCDSVSID